MTLRRGLINFALPALLTVVFGVPMTRAVEPIERIIAVVGSDPILTSELAAQIQMVAIQRNIRPKNQEELERLQKEILDQMIMEKLIQIEARKDTSIKVSSE